MHLLDLLFQSGTPDTSSGLMFGYGASAAIFFGYILSVILRANNTQNNLEMMEELTNEAE